jgi:hypothetical protein
MDPFRRHQARRLVSGPSLFLGTKIEGIAIPNLSHFQGEAGDREQTAIFPA